MTKVNMHEAKSRLSQLVELAKAGEDVVIAKNGEPQARLTAIEPEGKDWFGMDEGKIWMSDDFNELPDDILDLISDPKIFPEESEVEK